MAGRLLTVAGAALVFAGFFLPCMEGPGALSYREFSGLEVVQMLRQADLLAAYGWPAGGSQAVAWLIVALPCLAVARLVVEAGRGPMPLSSGLAVAQILLAAALMTYLLGFLDASLADLRHGLVMVLAGVGVQSAVLVGAGLKPALLRAPPAVA